VGDATWSHPQGTVSVAVHSDPFGLVVRDASGAVLVESSGQALSFTHNEDETVPGLMMGWDYYSGQDGPWQLATRATATATDGAALVVHLATTDASHGSVTLRIEPNGPGVRFVASVDDPGTDPHTNVNRVSLGWVMHDDAPGSPGDHFLGLGERFHLSDHRGQPKTYDWVEDKGLGQGEDTPPGPSNPLPNGPTMTYLPVPWFLSPRGFGLLLSSSYRTVFHLGDEAPDAWRFEAWTGALDATLFADRDPKNLLEDLTAITGRPPAVPDWALAPRRRGDPGSGEWDKLRAAHVPTTAIDTAVHYFPAGDGSDHSAMQAVTAELHAKGFRAIAYFCPFVADSWHPVYDDVAANGWFVKRPDGSPYVVLDPPYEAAMIDFTNPDAVAWYQAQMQQALDDGWDGWMYDFGEYVPLDAVFHDGMTGQEAHNIYPLLYEKAAFDLLERVRPGDYDVFARSGYAGPTPSGFLGTGGLLPMVWAGDQSTDFDLADGLPSALIAALNAGMSGIPLWGSDISGYHFIFNPPPDKELYIRWTELGAFSVDMHDENVGAGTGTRWQIWSDAETLSTYAMYAGLKTQMVPYTRLAVDQARAHGWPVMRHLYLDYPTDPRTWTISDEYDFGDSLLVAPVVTRGAVSRSVYLPGSAYYDYWTGQRVGGARDVQADAPLDVIPVYARMGAILPMLSPDVETLATPPDESTVYADVFAGGQSSVTLEDGTILAQSAPTEPFVPAGVAPQNETGGAGTLSIAVAAAPGGVTTTVDAPPLTLSVAPGNVVRHVVFRVRY
jgi:alpha-glucosidase (family GH31 glycosyl hydrolase)